MSETARERIEAEILRASEVVYKRPTWKLINKWMIFIFIVGLNVAMPMSLVERLSKHMTVNPGFELVQFLLLLCCDLYFLPVCLFEVNSVTVRGEQLIVTILLWKNTLSKKDIVSFKVPKMLTWGLLRTPRCFYLINRADTPNFDELAALIDQKYLG